MTQTEVEARIRQVLREAQEGATISSSNGLLSWSGHSVAYAVPQPPYIVTVPETSSLSKLVAETREQMRKERPVHQRWFYGTAVESSNLIDWPPSVGHARTFFQEWESNRSIDLSRAAVGRREPLPPPQATKPLVSNTTPAATADTDTRSPPRSPHESIVIQRAPAAQLHHLAKRLLEPEVYQRYVEPHLADMWFQYNAALRQGNEREARRVVWRGYFEVLKPIFFAALRMALSWWLRA